MPPYLEHFVFAATGHALAVRTPIHLHRLARLANAPPPSFSCLPVRSARLLLWCGLGGLGTANTSSAWPGRSHLSFLVRTSHTFMVESLLLLTSIRLSALQHT